MFDIIYVTWFVDITTAFISSKFWYTYLVVSAKDQRMRFITATPTKHTVRYSLIIDLVALLY